MSQPDPRRLGALVRAARQLAGWRQDELGRRCGYSASQVSRWETGTLPLYDTRVLWALVDVLDLPPVVLGLADPEESMPWPVARRERPSSEAAFDALARIAVSVSDGGRDRRHEPAPRRRRWTLRARDLLHRAVDLVTAAHPPAGTVTLHMPGPAVVLEVSDVRQLQRHLADALACLLAEEGDR